MITIYHNPRCAKSRAGLKYLESKKLDFTIRQYLKEPLTVAELSELLTKLGTEPLDMVRTQEAYFKENLKGKTLSNEEWIKEIAANPKLLQRPIVETGKNAVWAQPAERIDELL